MKFKIGEVVTYSHPMPEIYDVGTIIDSQHHNGVDWYQVKDSLTGNTSIVSEVWLVALNK